MKKTILTAATLVAFVTSAGMSMAAPSEVISQETSEIFDPGLPSKPEVSNSDNCDSCSDAKS